MAPLAVVEAGEPPPWIDPDVAIGRAFRRAAWLVSEGHAVEAAALMRAAEALERMWEAMQPRSAR